MSLGICYVIYVSSIVGTYFHITGNLPSVIQVVCAYIIFYLGCDLGTHVSLPYIMLWMNLIILGTPVTGDIFPVIHMVFIVC